MFKIFITLSLTINSFAFFNYPHNRKGITIDMENRSATEVALKSGETTNLNGSICVSKFHPITNQPKCYKLKSGNLPVRFYFPDKVTEVTEQVTLTKNGQELDFSYATPELLNDSENKFPANNKTRRYVYDGEDILLVLNENNEKLSKYTHSTLRIDDALAIDDKTNNRSYYFLKDHLGSIVDIVNEDLTSKQHYAYSSFGELQKVTDINGNDLTLNPILEHHFAYTGREYDQESGLYHYRARAYDASTGRFLQVDPHPGDVHNHLSLVNKYIYGNNNPVLLSDPNGRFAFLVAIVIGAAIGGIAAELSGGDFWEGAFLGAVIGAGGYAGFMAGGAASVGASHAVTASIGAGFLSSAVGTGAGVLVGASVGAVSGAVIGGLLMEASGEGSFRKGANLGAQIGYIAGGIGGGFSSFSSSPGFADGTYLGNFFSNPLSITALSVASLGVPFGVYSISSECGKPKPQDIIFGSTKCD